MKIIDIVEFANGSRTMPDIAEELGVSKDTLRRRLKSVGYVYDNSLKSIVFVGKESEKSQIDEMLFSSLVSVKAENNQSEIRKKSDIIKKDISETSEKNMKKVKEKSEENQNDLTDSEISILKELVHMMKSNESKLFLELSFLPESSEVKKSSIVISKEIHEQFEDFSKLFSNKRISKNSLVELALYEFMRKYR